MKRKGRRDRLQIKIDVLKVCRNGQILTWIYYKANLNYRLTKNIITELIEKGLLKKEGRTYHTTEKGEKAIALYEQLQQILN